MVEQPVGHAQSGGPLNREPCFRLLPKRASDAAETEHSWTLDFAARRAQAQALDDAVHGIKAANPREKKSVDQRTPQQLLAAIEAKGREVDEALGRLKVLLAS